MKYALHFTAAALVALPLTGCGGDDDPGVTTGTIDLALSDECGAGGLADATVTMAGADHLTATDGTLKLEDVAAGEHTLRFVKAGYLPAEVTVTVAAGGTVSPTEGLLCQRKAAGDIARNYLAKFTGDSALPAVTSAQAVFDNFMDGDDTNDPLVISTRSADHYALGHIPTAINIPWKSVATTEAMTQLGAPDASKPIVDYCYTGHTGGIAMSILGLLGYPTTNLKLGFASWTPDESARTAGATDPDQSKDFTVETTANAATETFDIPWMEYDGVETPEDVMTLAARDYLADEAMKPVMKAQDLFDNLNDGDTSNDPFIISVRSPDHYAIGHIPGAINIPWTQVALEENLAKIPTDRMVVVYCYTGHTGAIAAGVLGALGYHNVVNLKFGMAGWTQDADVRAKGTFNRANDVKDFPFVTGTEPGSF